MFEIKMVRPNDLDISVLSANFQTFFQDEPWNEHLICSSCKRPDDYGPAFSWGVQSTPATCPSCGATLKPFWCLDRTRTYLCKHDNAFGSIAYVNGEFIAWVWGYPLQESGCYYIDTVAILPTAKVQLGFLCLMESFRDFIQSLQEQGYTLIRTRTHKKAKRVRHLMRSFEFEEEDESTDDPSRTFWRLQLPTS